MAELRATSFFKGQCVTPAGQTLLTVPAGRRYIIKCITLKNETGATRVVSLWSSGVTRWLSKTLTASGTDGSSYTWNDGYLVLNAAQTLSISFDAAATIDVTVSGTNHYV